jgi:hypothetical protein
VWGSCLKGNGVRKIILTILLLLNLTVSYAVETLIISLPLPYEHFSKEHQKIIANHVEVEKKLLIKKPLSIQTKDFKTRLPSRYQKTYEDFLYLQLFSGSFVLGLWALPESISQWDRSELQKRDIFKNWYENIKMGPVQDTDKWWVNYGGHSLSGAYFYTMARNNGLTVAESTSFNFLMSTFYWEYGVEAFFEIPSSQDLWITPVLGSLLGEQFYQWELMIRANEGKVWGSESFGAFLLIILNPEGALANFLRMKEDRVSIDLVSRFSTYSQDQNIRHMMGEFGTWMESYIGFEISVAF